jgi:hypothetical protein
LDDDAWEPFRAEKIYDMRMLVLVLFRGMADHGINQHKKKNKKKGRRRKKERKKRKEEKMGKKKDRGGERL